MPTMIRPKGEATKIAYSILGKPANMENKSIFNKNVDSALLRQQTYRLK